MYCRKRAVEEIKKKEDIKHKEEVEERQRPAFIDKTLVKPSPKADVLAVNVLSAKK